LLLVDAMPMVQVVMPILCSLGDVCGLTEARDEHATSLVAAYFVMRRVQKQLDALEEENCSLYGIPRGVEGPGGNFSNSLRTVVRAQVASLKRQLARLTLLRIPFVIIKAMNMKPRLTLMNERFYSICRRLYPLPYTLQWEEQRATNIMEEAKSGLDASGFSYFTGSQSPGRRHYQEDGIRPARVLYRPRSARRVQALKPGIRQRRLEVLRRFAAEFQGVAQQTVTSKGKEQSGVLPSIYYEPPEGSNPSDKERQHVLASLFARAGPSAEESTGDAGKSSSSRVFFGARDIVIIKADKRMRMGEVWLAELGEPLLVTKVCGQLQLSAERLSVRYFALDAERAENGTLRYEFEYDAHVYYNQIYGAIRRTSRRRYNGLPSRLHSFDLSEEEYERARQLVSGSAGPPPIAIEFEEFGDDGAADAGAVERELAMHEAPARKVRKAPAKRKRPESNAVVASIPSVGEA